MDMGVLDTDSLVPAGKFALTLTFCKVKFTLVGLMSTQLQEIVHLVGLMSTRLQEIVHPCSVVRM